MDFSEKQINKIDIDGMRGQISSLYDQVKHSIDIMNSFKSKNYSYSNIIDNYNKILIIGMGGSAIGADFARTIVQNNISIPISVVRDYSIPNWVDKKTFIIASSYSGNTEETLSAYNECLKRGCSSIIISTGGELTRIAVDNKVGIIKLPRGYQPRAAIGYSLSILLLLFVEIGLISKKYIKDLNQVVDNQLGKKYLNEAKLIAQKLVKTFPIIYSGSGYMEILSTRLRGQLAENAKILSYQSVFPEHNHNEIEGWSKNLEEMNSKFSIVWLKDENDSSYIQKRMGIVKDIIRDYPSQQFEIQVSGESILERVFTMIHTIDWISFYLAILYDSNPSPVGNISQLKSLMVE